MNLTVISATIAFACGFSVAWGTQTLRIQHADKQRSEIAQESERLVHASESRRSAQVISAQNSARVREGKLRADAAASHAAADSLRSALSTVVQAVRDDPATCPDRAATTAEIFIQCGSALGELAAKADRHVSDLKTLIDSYPKE